MRWHFLPKINYLFFLFLLTAEPLPGERSGYNLSNYTPNLATPIYESLCVYSLLENFSSDGVSTTVVHYCGENRMVSPKKELHLRVPCRFIKYPINRFWQHDIRLVQWKTAIILKMTNDGVISANSHRCWRRSNRCGAIIEVKSSDHSKILIKTMNCHLFQLLEI